MLSGERYCAPHIGDEHNRGSRYDHDANPDRRSHRSHPMGKSCSNACGTGLRGYRGRTKAVRYRPAHSLTEGQSMTRRECITLAGGAALALSLSARAQRAAVPVIGLLTVANPPEWATNGIRVGLAEAGYVEGRNLIIITRSAEGQFSRLRALAADLVGNEVVVILAAGSPVPARASKEATAKIPIVFAYGGDPVADGLIDSLNRPAANITGATFIGTALLAKRMELLREIVPWAIDVALLVNTNGTLAERQIGCQGGRTRVASTSSCHRYQERRRNRHSVREHEPVKGGRVCC